MPVILKKDQSFYSEDNQGFSHRYRRLVMAGFIILSDVFAMLISMTVAWLLWSYVRDDLPFNTYQALVLPIIGLFLAIYYLSGFYPGIGIGPVEELRRLSIGTSLGMFALMGLSFYLRNTTDWSRAVLGLTWVFMIAGMPLARKMARRMAVRMDIWGVPAVMIGEGDGIWPVYESLRRNRLSGLMPVLCIKTSSLQDIFPRPVEAHETDWDGKALFAGIDIAIIVPQQAPLGAVKNVLLDRTHSFKRVIVMFDETRMGALWFTPIYLVEQFGLEARHELIDRNQQMIKRNIDLLLIIVSLPLLLPLFGMIALAIKWDSKGPVFYTQNRVGRNGREVRMWKFRSMVVDAEQVLKKYLESDPALQKEWDENFKLKHDPRITRVGRFLRRTSLDELPQLWNVLQQQMSIIGPRPIVTDEIPLYGDDFYIYSQVLPGMTGMWQISGRNDLSYEERVNLDVYYVQNWSIWLDIHILLHTIIALLMVRGAY